MGTLRITVVVVLVTAAVVVSGEVKGSVEGRSDPMEMRGVEGYIDMKRYKDGRRGVDGTEKRKSVMRGVGEVTDVVPNGEFMKASGVEREMDVERSMDDMSCVEGFLNRESVMRIAGEMRGVVETKGVHMEVKNVEDVMDAERNREEEKRMELREGERSEKVRGMERKEKGVRGDGDKKGTINNGVNARNTDENKIKTTGKTIKHEAGRRKNRKNNTKREKGPNSVLTVKDSAHRKTTQTDEGNRRKREIMAENPGTRKEKLPGKFRQDGSSYYDYNEGAQTGGQDGNGADGEYYNDYEEGTDTGGGDEGGATGEEGAEEGATGEGGEGGAEGGATGEGGAEGGATGEGGAEGGATGEGGAEEGATGEGGGTGEQSGGAGEGDYGEEYEGGDGEDGDDRQTATTVPPTTTQTPTTTQPPSSTTPVTTTQAPTTTQLPITTQETTTIPNATTTEPFITTFIPVTNTTTSSTTTTTTFPTPITTTLGSYFIGDKWYWASGSRRPVLPPFSPQPTPLPPSQPTGNSFGVFDNAQPGLPGNGFGQFDNGQAGNGFGQFGNAFGQVDNGFGQVSNGFGLFRNQFGQTNNRFNQVAGPRSQSTNRVKMKNTWGWINSVTLKPELSVTDISQGNNNDRTHRHKVMGTNRLKNMKPSLMTPAWTTIQPTKSKNPVHNQRFSTSHTFRSSHSVHENSGQRNQYTSKSHNRKHYTKNMYSPHSWSTQSGSQLSINHHNEGYDHYAPFRTLALESSSGHLDRSWG